MYFHCPHACCDGHFTFAYKRCQFIRSLLLHAGWIVQPFPSSYNFIQQHALFATCMKTRKWHFYHTTFSVPWSVCYNFFCPWLNLLTSTLYLRQQTCAFYDSTTRLCASYNNSKTSPHNSEQYTNAYFELYTTRKQGYKLC